MLYGLVFTQRTLTHSQENRGDGFPSKPSNPLPWDGIRMRLPTAA